MTFCEKQIKLIFRVINEPVRYCETIYCRLVYSTKVHYKRIIYKRPHIVITSESEYLSIICFRELETKMHCKCIVVLWNSWIAAFNSKRSWRRVCIQRKEISIVISVHIRTRDPNESQTVLNDNIYKRCISQDRLCTSLPTISSIIRIRRNGKITFSTIFPCTIPILHIGIHKYIFRIACRYRSAIFVQKCLYHPFLHTCRVFPFKLWITSIRMKIIVGDRNPDRILQAAPLGKNV